MEEIGLLEQGNMPNDGECLQGRFRVKSNFSQRYNKNLSYYIGQPWKKYSSILLVKGESLGGQRTMEHQQLQSDKWTLPGGTTISWRSYGRTGRSDWELGYQILKEQCWVRWVLCVWHISQKCVYKTTFSYIHLLTVDQSEICQGVLSSLWEKRNKKELLDEALQATGCTPPTPFY